MFNWGKGLLNSFWNDPLGSIFDGFKSLVIDPIVGFFTHLWGEILKAIYMLWSTMASILDTIQIIYNMMVGTSEVVWQSTSSMGQSYSDATGALGANMSGVTHNLVVDVFLSDYVMGALLKVIVLSLFLLLIFTMIAIVKIEYSKEHDYSDPKKHNATSKRPIIERAIKSLISFLLIPLACIFGVIASGVLMQAIDGATSPTSNTIISNKIFAICAHDANRVRTDGDFYAGLIHDSSGQFDAYDLSNDMTWNPNFATQTSQNELADYIDKLFTNGTSLQQAGVVQTGETYRFRGSNDKFSNFYENGGGISKNAFFNTKNSAQVFYFYDLTHFQWLIGFFTIFYMGTILIRITLGAAGRLFELAILFVISPAILSMAPLDEGKAMGNWTKKFVGKVGMIYAPVVAINLYFILVGVLVQVDFGSSIDLAVTKGFGSEVSITGTGLTNVFVQQIFNLFILIAGLQVCESSIKWLSELIGAEDINAAGDSIRKSMSNFVQTNAAAKYLATNAGKAKAAALTAAARPGARLKEGIQDYKNKGLTQKIQTAEAGKFNKEQAEKDKEQNKLKDANKNIDTENVNLNNKLNDINNNTASLNKSIQDYTSGGGASEEVLGAYNASLSVAQAKYANRTDLSEEQKANKAADDAMGMLQTMDGGKYVSQLGNAFDSAENLSEFRTAASALSARKESENKAKEVQAQIDAKNKEKADNEKKIQQIEKDKEEAAQRFAESQKEVAQRVRGMSRDEKHQADRDYTIENQHLAEKGELDAAMKSAKIKNTIQNVKAATKKSWKYSSTMTSIGNAWDAGGAGGGDKDKKK